MESAQLTPRFSAQREHGKLSDWRYGTVTWEIPRVLFDWPRLSDAARNAFMILWEFNGRAPGLIEVPMCEWGAALGKSSSSATRWRAALLRCGLIEELPMTSAAGHPLFELQEPVARAIQMRIVEPPPPDPQLHLPGLDDEIEPATEGVTTGTGTVTGKGSTGSDTGTGRLRIISPGPEDSDEVAPTGGGTGTGKGSTGGGTGTGSDPLACQPANGDVRREKMMAALGASLGVERAQLWFGSTRFNWSDDSLLVFAPDEFTVDRLRRFTGDLAAAAESIGHGQVGVDFGVDGSIAFRPLPSAAEAQLKERKETNQENKNGRASAAEGSGRKANEWRHFQRVLALEDGDRSSPILVRGENLYCTCQDESLYPWIAIYLAWACEHGIPPVVAFQLADMHRGQRGFYGLVPTIFTQHGLRWPDTNVLGSVKVTLVKAGVIWRDHWTEAAAKRNGWGAWRISS